MTPQEQIMLVQTAIATNHSKELFLGIAPYTWGNLKHIPANVATDIGAIIDNGMYELYRAGDTNIPDTIAVTIKELLLLNQPQATWTAYFILRYQYRNEVKNKSPFKIVTPHLCQAVSTAIADQKHSLTSCKEYAGNGLQNGLWDDIQRLEGILVANYGVSII